MSEARRSSAGGLRRKKTVGTTVLHWRWLRLRVRLADTLPCPVENCYNLRRLLSLELQLWTLPINDGTAAVEHKLVSRQSRKPTAGKQVHI